MFYNEADQQSCTQLDMCDVVEQPLEHILIIDDDFDQTEVLAHRFRKQGYNVSVATTFCDGLATAKAEHPNVVVLDLGLPDGDGLDICTELSGERTTADIPVITVSGMERPDIVRTAREAGCQYYVRKPYDPNALLILVQHAITEARDWC